jgi:hypothetical protein
MPQPSIYPGETPDQRALRDQREAHVRTIRRHISGWDNPEAQSLGVALLDLGIAAANALDRSPDGALEMLGFWSGLPAMRGDHVQAAVLILAQDHEAGPKGAYDCITAVGEFVHNMRPLD